MTLTNSARKCLYTAAGVSRVRGDGVENLLPGLTGARLPVFRSDVDRRRGGPGGVPRWGLPGRERSPAPPPALLDRRSAELFADTVHRDHGSPTRVARVLHVDTPLAFIDAAVHALERSPSQRDGTSSSFSTGRSWPPSRRVTCRCPVVVKVIRRWPQGRRSCETGRIPPRSPRSSSPAPSCGMGPPAGHPGAGQCAWSVPTSCGIRASTRSLSRFHTGRRQIARRRPRR